MVERRRERGRERERGNGWYAGGRLSIGSSGG